MTNNKRFNAILNSRQNPRAVYNALLAPDIKEARKHEQSR